MTRIAKRYLGVHQARLPHNPMEKKFVAAWQRLNTASFHRVSFLASLLQRDTDFVPKEPTERDWQVANTLIQWLGSPVGQHFIKDVMRKKLDE